MVGVLVVVLVAAFVAVGRPVRNKSQSNSIFLEMLLMVGRCVRGRKGAFVERETCLFACNK